MTHIMIYNAGAVLKTIIEAYASFKSPQNLLLSFCTIFVVFIVTITELPVSYVFQFNISQRLFKYFFCDNFRPVYARWQGGLIVLLNLWTATLRDLLTCLLQQIAFSTKLNFPHKGFRHTLSKFHDIVIISAFVMVTISFLFKLSIRIIFLTNGFFWQRLFTYFYRYSYLFAEISMNQNLQTIGYFKNQI